MKRSWWRGVAAAAVLALGATVAWAGDDTISAARDLYASAAYEDALALLNRLRAAGVKGSDQRAVEQYRAFCLLALGRGSEAEDAIAAVINAEPSYHPSDSDVSPRILTAFSDVRRRMLPGIIQQKYADAKNAFDRKDFVAAESGFSAVLAAMSDPDVGAAANQPPLSDLRVLANGFHELAAAAAAPPPAPPPPPPPPVAAAPAPERPAAPRIYGVGDANAVPPVTIRQTMPSFPGRILAPTHGTIEIIIDEEGAVESAVMRQPINGFYDTLTLAATKTWKYRPATVGGKPVKYRKLIAIALNP